MKGTSLHRAVTAAFAGALLLLSGCGDTLRPVANPLPQTGGPDPQAASFALVVSAPPTSAGAPAPQRILSVFNMPGDTVLGQVSVGTGANFVTTPDAVRGLITDSAENTLTIVTNLSSQFSQSPTVAAIALQPGAAPDQVITNGTTAYTSNVGNGTVGVVSLITNVEQTEVPVGANPVSLALPTNANKLYAVTNASANGGQDGVAVVSTADNTLLSTLTGANGIGVNPVQVVASPDGSNVFVVNNGSSTVSQISTANDTIVNQPIAVAAGPTSATFDSKLTRLLVVSPGSGTVTVIDVNSSSATFQRATQITLPAGSSPVSVTVAGDGTRAYVANAGTNSVSVVDVLGLRLVGSPIAVGGAAPQSIASSSDGTKVIVTKADNTVTMLSTASNSTTATLGLPGTPMSLSVNP
ncbi:MAG TPA: YncE family protein [Terriglobales bacterium]|jgi:YVTN family beta-propeller protein